MLYFLAEEGGASPVVRKHERKKLLLPHSKVAYELLTPDLNRKMEMFIAQVYPSQANIALPLAQPTEECILLLEGRLSVCLDEVEYILEPGDSIYFEGSRLKGLAARGVDPALFVSAVTPPVF